MVTLIFKKSPKSSIKVLHIVKSCNILPIVVPELSTLEIYHIQPHLKTSSAHSPVRLGKLRFVPFDISHRALFTCKKSKKIVDPTFHFVVELTWNDPPVKTVRMRSKYLFFRWFSITTFIKKNIHFFPFIMTKILFCTKIRLE